MKVSIVTFSYEPIQAPRAFRAVELAQEFARQGHDVVVYNCSQVDGFSYQKLESERLKIVNVKGGGVRGKGPVTAPGSRKNTKLIRVFKNFLFYLTTNRYLIAFLKLNRSLRFEGRSDILISIGLPFHVHWAVSRKIKSEGVAGICIADYGDPFSRYNPTCVVAPYFQLIEKHAMLNFDYITVPTQKSVSSYLWLKPEDKIKVIPQGFTLDFVSNELYKKNAIPTFAFAGRFYSGIRDPKGFFEYLVSLDADFVFYIFAAGQGESGALVQEYVEKLRGKVVVCDPIPRKELLKELGKMDFLINMNNVNANQSPSKLIDYAITKRPIFSFTQNSFDKNKFERFLAGDYSGAEEVDVESYNIEKIVSEFLQLSK